MNDTDKMPFGKYKGEQMINVPDSYLIWLWNQNKDKYQSGGFSLSLDCKRVMAYIQDSFNESDL